MKLDAKLLSSKKITEISPKYQSCLNAKGLYNSMHFILCLRYDIHKELEKARAVGTSKEFTFETAQAFSTYLHETVHWWQHIGSTSGLVLGFVHPAQAHINATDLKEYLQNIGLIKPVIKYNELNSNAEIQDSKEFSTINKILNNFHDVEFFRQILLDPNSVQTIVKNPYFESVGHSFHITYSSVINLLSSTIDTGLKYLPKADQWHKGFSKNRENKVKNYYLGSDVIVAPFGVKELYEGQARFIQLQYLYFGSNKSLNWSDFKKLGMLEGVYYSAFSIYLEITNSELPENIGSSTVGLFLLLIDIAINPTIGFPFDIQNYETFIEDTDPCVRYIKLCNIVAVKYPELKGSIVNYSSSEYFQVSSILSKSLSSPSPLEASKKVVEWSKNNPELIELMEQEKTFKFKEENQPVRLLFSRYIRFQEDKLKFPEFFCWPGIYLAGQKITESSMALFDEHQALFGDKEDGDIYPRAFPDKDEEVVHEAFELFYSWVSTYDLSRQLIYNEGAFSYDYFWLTSQHSMEDNKSWARRNFKLAYGVDPSDFTVL